MPLTESRFALLLVRQSNSIFVFSCISTPVVIEFCRYNDERPSLKDFARFKIDRPAACPRAEGNKAGRKGDRRAITGDRDAWTSSSSLVTWENISFIGRLSSVVFRSEYNVEPDGPARLTAHGFSK
ncbi:hypothetical protein HBI56_131440 [Parastagonospora nodorum]|nr:hypothetical protein HBH53_218250 [Parastagonospora nodorum]KAH3996824.1 hypothetical protein HBI10_153360 [Parastagonospora nodorum]KAH4012574.1 hypothetical protein HBI13_188050 [Parastagonospora nodorum]KAH4029582.1 hypothetical protein HBI09_135170 [Parastagonospora nodorum]KAH4047523.1 hypothetical protein HBH49_166330 [Parastagonospora nodorum]